MPRQFGRDRLLALFCTVLVSACSSGDSNWFDEGHHYDAAQSQNADTARELQGSKPNIVLILADDLGYYDPGFTGNTFYETPNMDRLAAEGAVFEHSYSSGPNCAPSRASLMTGMTTPRHEIYTPNGGSRVAPEDAPLWTPINERFFKDSAVEREAYESQYASEGLHFFPSRTILADAVSMANILNEAGYTTARLGKWHLGPETLGFDLSSSDGQDRIRNGKADRVDHYDNPHVAKTITEAAVKFIKDNSNRPFFLYMPHWEPHFPLVADAKIVDKYKAKKVVGGEQYAPYNATYAAMVEAVDTSVAGILDALDAAGVADNTLVIFLSDNGGTNFTIQRELRATKGSLYQGGIRVPMAVRWPGVVKQGARISEVVSSVDFFPTFAELAGVNLSKIRKPSRQVLDGRSLVPLLSGQQGADWPAFFHFPLYLVSNAPGGPVAGFRAWPSSAVIQGPWKLIEYFDAGEGEDDSKIVNRFELYNLEADPGESLNLVNETYTPDSETGQVLQLLSRRLLEWRQRSDAPLPVRKNRFFAPGGD